MLLKKLVVDKILILEPTSSFFVIEISFTMSQSTGIPVPIRRVQLNHLSELPNDYGTTPGGTLFSTTPGGTRIIYDRSFLLKCRASPLSNTPPINLPDIPGVTSPEKLKINRKIVEEAVAGKENGDPRRDEAHQFDMEI